MSEVHREAGSTGPEPPLRVFLSYRRTDDINVVGRFHDHLLEWFGDDNVFRDLDSVHGGSNFPRLIKEEMARVDAVAAMIGPTWASRLGRPNDFVELEIGEALRRGCPVIPILIQGAPLPSPDQLPASMRGLLDLNAVTLRPDPDYRRDSAWAIEGIVTEATAYRGQKDARKRQVEAEAAAAAAQGATRRQRRKRRPPQSPRRNGQRPLPMPRMTRRSRMMMPAGWSPSSSLPTAETIRNGGGGCGRSPPRRW